MEIKRTIFIGFSLLLIVFVISMVTFYMSIGKCAAGSFSCDNGIKCVLQRDVCDRKFDCKDMEDEHPAICGRYYGSLEFFGSLLPRKKDEEGPKDKYICVLKDYPKNDCVCGYSTGLVCTHSNLTDVPKASPQVTSMLLLNNQIVLKNDSFDNLNLTNQLHLKNNRITDIPSATFQHQRSLKKLYLEQNSIRKIHRGAFRSLISLKWLTLKRNKLKYLSLLEFQTMQSLTWLELSFNRLTLYGERFPRLKNIYEIELDYNAIEEIDEVLFSALDHLQLLSLNYNQIRYIHPDAFINLISLRDLRISNNRLKQLPSLLFRNLILLDVLNLAYNDLKIGRELFQSSNLSFLNIEGIDYVSIDFEAINQVSSLRSIAYDSFYYCSMTPNIKNCMPNTDGVSSLEDLLAKPVLRYSTWIMATLTCIGNGLVLWGRFIGRDENHCVSIVIRNLAVADIMMGLYLTIIGVQDYRYRQMYHQMALDWLESWNCAMAGILAMISSEVSLLILAFMSVERFLLIANPFGGHRRLTKQNIFMFLLTIWLVGSTIAIIPLIHYRTTTHFYGLHSGTCFPLHLLERFDVGWQYSAFIFLGINFFLLLLIVISYTALFISIMHTRRATPLGILDREFAVRFFFIVLTDVCCWAPIMAVKICVFLSFKIPAETYAWLVVFVLPLNSAINPLLYTFTTPKYRSKIVHRNWHVFLIRKDEHSNKTEGSGERQMSN